MDNQKITSASKRVIDRWTTLGIKSNKIQADLVMVSDAKANVESLIAQRLKSPQPEGATVRGYDIQPNNLLSTLQICL